MQVSRVPLRGERNSFALTPLPFHNPLEGILARALFLVFFRWKECGGLDPLALGQGDQTKKVDSKKKKKKTQTIH
jgi:hypothetical protein